MIKVKRILPETAEWLEFDSKYKEFGCLPIVPHQEDHILGVFVGKRLVAGSILSPSLERYLQYSNQCSVFQSVADVIQQGNVCSIYGFWRKKFLTRIEKLAFLIMIFKWGRYVKEQKIEFVVSGASHPKLMQLYRSFQPLDAVPISKSTVGRTVFVYKTADATAGVRYYLKKTANEMLNKKPKLVSTDSKPIEIQDHTQKIRNIRMKELMKEIDIAQDQFKMALEAIQSRGGVTVAQYISYLSMQYHLTLDVQRYFYAIASHSDFAHCKSLRTFLINFGNEEEPHYQIAANDLKNLKAEIEPITLDVKLWHAYFKSNVAENPYLRLGAVAILENISGKSAHSINEILFKSSFTTPRNTRFFAIHRHDETIPHGDQILEALVSAKLNPEQMKSIVQGAREARTMYMRMVQTAVSGKQVLARIDQDAEWTLINHMTSTAV